MPAGCQCSRDPTAALTRGAHRHHRHNRRHLRRCLPFPTQALVAGPLTLASSGHPSWTQAWVLEPRATSPTTTRTVHGRQVLLPISGLVTTSRWAAAEATLVDFPLLTVPGTFLRGTGQCPTTQRQGPTPCTTKVPPQPGIRHRAHTWCGSRIPTEDTMVFNVLMAPARRRAGSLPNGGLSQSRHHGLRVEPHLPVCLVLPVRLHPLAPP